MIQAPSQLTHEASLEVAGDPSLHDSLESVGEKLSEANLGSWVCSEINGPGESVSRMRSLGICVGRPLDLVAVGDPMIVQVGSAQIGLSRYLASHVTVRSCDRVGCAEQGRCLDQEGCVVPMTIDPASTVSASMDRLQRDSNHPNEPNVAVS